MFQYRLQLHLNWWKGDDGWGKEEIAKVGQCSYCAVHDCGSAVACWHLASCCSSLPLMSSQFKLRGLRPLHFHSVERRNQNILVKILNDGWGFSSILSTKVGTHRGISLTMKTFASVFIKHLKGSKVTELSCLCCHLRFLESLSLHIV